MDRDEAIRRAEIARKWAEGEAVEWRPANGDTWTLMPPPESFDVGPCFFDPLDCFRQQPKPLGPHARGDQ